MSTEVMTRSDRESLIKIARQRERVAKSAAKERAAFLVADFERQLDHTFRFDENEVWEKATLAAGKVVHDAKKLIADECQRLGIPKEFAPDLSFHWWGKGENATKGRRGELRRLAARQIEAAEASARLAIESQSVQVQEGIMIGGLATDDARRFLESMPSADALMPAIAIENVQAAMLTTRGRQ